jgi:hypothetical protein
MEALIKSRRDGSVDLHLDGEAARAMFASVSLRVPIPRRDRTTGEACKRDDAM